MAYCNIENYFLGRKLDSMFSEHNRNIISNIIASEDFKKWFGKGKVDIDGNPLIDNMLSFTNEKGEKRTLFDLDIQFEGKGEVYKFVSSLPGVRLYNSTLFINNTVKGTDGHFLAKDAAKSINVINYYYPNLLSVDIYQRQGLSQFSKDKSIPLPIITVNEINRTGTLFSIHETMVPAESKSNEQVFSQIKSIDELKAIQNTLDEYRQYGITEANYMNLVENNKISEKTYNKLRDFLIKLNPSFKIEEMDNLSENGKAYISQFLIQIDSEAKYEAMPEEVAHFFVELLPQDSKLRMDMMDNITAFAIYPITLNTYKEKKEYQKDNGQPDYDKIKREASAKLIAEYIKNLSEGDMASANLLLKTKDNFIKRWWDSFINWLKDTLNLTRKERFHSYMEAASAILEGNIDYLTMDNITESANNDVFFSLSDKTKMDIEMGKHILDNLTKQGKIGHLQTIIDKFRRELRTNFIKIVKEEGFQELNNKLSDKDTEVNYLSELYDIIKKVDVRESKLDDLVASDSQVLNFSQFLHVIQHMDNVAHAIDGLVDQYTADGKMESIAELQSFMDIYSNFKSFVDTDFASLLAGSDVELEVIARIKSSMVTFSALQDKIINKLRDTFTVFYSKLLKPYNQVILDKFSEEIKKSFLFQERRNPAHEQVIISSVEKFRKNLIDNIDLFKAKEILLLELKSGGISDKVLNSALISELLNQINNLHTPDSMVRDFMKGLGKPIDLTSEALHMVSAAIKNHDMMISSVANFIVEKRTESQQLALYATKAFAHTVAPTLERLIQLGFDEYKSGEAITYIDYITDMSVDEKTGKPKYKDNKRPVVKFLSPTLNSAYIEQERLLKIKNDLYTEYLKDPNSEEGKRLKEEVAKARREYINFNDNYMNSPFTKEYTDFQKTWASNDKFLEIKERYNKLSNEIRELQNFFENDKRDDQAYKAWVNKIRERGQLLDIKGKSDEEVESINLLKQFFEESSKFRITDDRQTARNFNVALSNYDARLDTAIGEFLREGKRTGNYGLDNLERIMQEKMKDNTLRIKFPYLLQIRDEEENLSPDQVFTDDEVALVKKILMDKFESRNRVKVRTDHYYKIRDGILKEIEDLKAKNGLSEIDLMITDLWKEMQDLMVSKSDLYGQKNPELLSDDQLARVDELEDKIDNLKKYTSKEYKIYQILDSVKENPSFIPYKAYMDEYEQLAKDIQDYILERSSISEKDFNKKAERLAYLNEGLEAEGIITPEQKKSVKDIQLAYSDLAALSEKKPTEAYWEIMDTAIPAFENMLERELNNKDAGNKYSQSEIENLQYLLDGLIEAIHGKNHELLDEIINDEYYVTIQKQGKAPSYRKIEFIKYLQSYIEDIDSPMDIEAGDFSNWFLSSHKEGKVWVKQYDEEGNQIKPAPRERIFNRRMYYNYSDPTMRVDPTGGILYENKEAKRYRATKINDGPIYNEDGSLKSETGYRKKQISWKDTDNMEDWTVDNKSNTTTYLPLSRKQLQENGKTDTKYTNNDYYNLINAKDEKGLLLQKYLTDSVKTFMEEQENKPDRIKSGLNLPVTNLDEYQRMKEDLIHTQDRVKRAGQTIQSLFTKNDAIMAEDQISGIQQKRDVDEYSQSIINEKLPAMGMNAKLPVERVNRNVLHAINQYIIHSKDFDVRSDLNPFVRALIEVMKKNEEQGHRSQEKTRKIYEKIYSQMILEEMPSNVTNNAQFRKAVSILLKMTGVKLVADGIGGGINYLQANINNIIESFASEHATLRSYGVGYTKASVMMGDLFQDFSKKDNFHYWTMMYQTFDFIQGEWEEDITERASSKDKKFNYKKILMYPRKNGELHAQSAMAIAILDNNKIKNQIDGKLYPMWDIYKKDGNNLVVKDGFWKDEQNEDGTITRTYPYDPLTGSEFKRVKALIHSVNMDLHGNYAKLNQTEASRYSIGKLAENMKRWFVSNLQRRFGREGIDVGKGDLDQGYYLTPVVAITSIVKQLWKKNTTEANNYFNYYWTTPRKRENLKRFSADMTLAIGLFMLTTLGFGYDNDDPDKNKKLTNSSWLYNESLLLFLRTYAEHTAFIPVPPFGFTEMTRNLLDPFSVVKGSVGNAAGAISLTMFTLLYKLGFDSFKNNSIYSKDTGAGKGPTIPLLDDIFIHGKEGDYKLANYIAKLFGYNGSQVDPVFYIKNFENLQNRLK